MLNFKCIFCNSDVECTEEFYDETEKICCMHCNKAFDKPPKRHSVSMEDALKYFDLGIDYKKGDSNDDSEGWF